MLNVVHETTPSIIHGNGPSKMFLNNYGNYIAGAFVNDECMECKERIVKLKVSENSKYLCNMLCKLLFPTSQDDRELPTITFAVFILQATPFFKRFLQLIESLDYPKDKLDIFFYNAVCKLNISRCIHSITIQNSLPFTERNLQRWSCRMLRRIERLPKHPMDWRPEYRWGDVP